MKAAKKLQIIAVALYAAALMLLVVCILGQDLIKSIYGLDPSLREIRVIPYPSIISGVIHLALALVWLVVLLRKPDRRTTIIITVITGVIFIGYAVLSPFISSMFSMLIVQSGKAAAYSAVLSGTSLVTSFIASPAPFLMFLSLGIACGISSRNPSETV